MCSRSTTGAAATVWAGCSIKEKSSLSAFFPLDTRPPRAILGACERVIPERASTPPRRTPPNALAPPSREPAGRGGGLGLLRRSQLLGQRRYEQGVPNLKKQKGANCA